MDVPLLADVKALALSGSGDVWAGGVDAEGQAQICQLGPDATQTIAVPSVSDLAAGTESSLYVTGVTSGAFDVGQGPVVVDGGYAARYDGETGDAAWFVPIDSSGTSPRIARTLKGVVIGSSELFALDD